MLMKNSKTLSTGCVISAALVCMSLLTGCSTDRQPYFVTGSDYLTLKAGQAFVAPRDMTLATESVIQRKDEQILDLLRVNQQLVRELQMKGTP